MYHHAPQKYSYLPCLVARGVENEKVETKQADVVYKEGSVISFISSPWWPNNLSHVVIIPNKHFENIYDLSNAYSDKIHRLAKG